MRIYSASQVCRVHVELTSACNAACPMCPRTRSGGQRNPNLPRAELTLADFEAMFPPDLLGGLKQFLFCGNYGDALVARDTLPIVEYLRTTNPKLRIKLVTNGSGRDAVFWKKLAKLATTVTFSIDGLGETNRLYRRRTSWDRIMAAVTAYLGAGGRAEWDFLVFRHNEHQVKEAEALAKSLGFAKFNLKRSQRFLVEGRAEERFPVLGQDGKVSYYLELPEQAEHQNSGFVDLSRLTGGEKSYGDYLRSTRIACKAVRDEQVYLSATGHLFPCCWLGQIYDSWPSPMAEEIRSRIAELPAGLADLDLRRHGFAEIISGRFFQQLVVRGWDVTTPAGRLSACGRMCGEIDTHSRQWDGPPVPPAVQK
ncbi:MAG TPA: radical SAM protein [Pseudomonadota bacterium]|jgi:MoaA/NifB/PqqE/SkfB family radical SAM enzyme|nr:radical SAM protein [Pseudomonadota bacterium]HNI59272.1 radical SAM protein [Pseudomonadota bacterium]HNK46445.1 radical SAM protein [Pseudomonadota bacterium]HNN52972.1 radical SAM protein [Pseudomonadota bacterium]